MKPILVVLAAGLGSRYGGLKQMDKLGPDGESIIDYSVFDAASAGFGKVVFVLREEIVDDFYTLFANRYTSRIDVDHVVQRITDIPSGVKVHPQRIKPWGTGHAMLSAKSKLTAPFAVINGDDFYGADAFRVMHDFLAEADRDEISTQSMVGYTLRKTLSEHGFVSRGICSVNSSGYLTGVVERTHIEKKNSGIVFLDENENEQFLSGDEIVSMNIWGFTPAILDQFSLLFDRFMMDKGSELKSEFYIPYGINLLIEEGITKVNVLKSSATWFGVTYAEDKPIVVKKINELIQDGVYPEKLW